MITFLGRHDMNFPLQNHLSNRSIEVNRVDDKGSW